MSLGPGTRLGPYEILSALGAGGMGEVYKARDTRLDRTVALKVLPAELAADPDRRARFEREARAIAALSHPHICAIHDVGRHDEHRLPGDGVPRGRDAGRTAWDARKGVRCRSTRRLAIRDRDCRRARQGASRRHRASRSQARQHHAHEVGREAARLRPREAQRPGRADLDDGDRAARRRPAARRRRPARSSARCITWRRSKSKGARLTRAATSGRSASSSTRWPPARGRSRANRPPASSARF